MLVGRMSRTPDITHDQSPLHIPSDEASMRLRELTTPAVTTPAIENDSDHATLEGDASRSQPTASPPGNLGHLEYYRQSAQYESVPLYHNGASSSSALSQTASSNVNPQQWPQNLNNNFGEGGNRVSGLRVRSRGPRWTYNAANQLCRSVQGADFRAQRNDIFRSASNHSRDPQPTYTCARGLDHPAQRAGVQANQTHGFFPDGRSSFGPQPTLPPPNIPQRPWEYAQRPGYTQAGSTGASGFYGGGGSTGGPAMASAPNYHNDVSGWNRVDANTHMPALTNASQHYPLPPVQQSNPGLQPSGPVNPSAPWMTLSRVPVIEGDHPEGRILMCTVGYYQPTKRMWFDCAGPGCRRRFNTQDDAEDHYRQFHINQ
jgi:hypothetical protein